MSGLPAGIHIEGVLKTLTAEAKPYYILQTGNHDSGVILLKLNGFENGIRLITQQRNFMTDALEWVDVLKDESPSEQEVDEYIQRAKDRDPDLWIIEIEDPDLQNPFDV